MTRAEFDALPDHVARGLASGLPYCCVAYYCLLWPRLTHFERWRRSHDPATGYSTGWGYIPCDLCLRDTRWVPIVIHE